MTTIQLFWLLLGTSWALLEIAIVIKTRVPEPGKDQSTFRSARWIWLAIIASLITAVIFKKLQLLPLPITYLQRQVIALLILSIGLVLRFYAIVSLGRFFSTNAIIQTQHELIELGPYCYIRHPAYTGLLISFFAAGLAMGDMLALLFLLCPLTYVLGRRIALEEQLLIDHFGQVYYDYCQRTKKLIPWLY
jgi:protein-S-isoprenylcysteine O-methyltransferase Ste14